MRRSSRATLATAVALLFGSLVGSRSAAQSTSPSAQPPTATFRSSVEAVSVSVTVRDGRGRVVEDLKRDDFQVIDSGVSRAITDFYAGEAPISLAILLDISGSMSVGGNIERARDAITVLLALLQPPRDEAALYTFDSKLQEIVPFTTDLDRIKRVSLEGTPWGVTSLFDSIGGTAQTVAERANRHRALLVVTDGVDTASKMSAAQVSGIASSIDVPVYLLTVVTPTDHPGGEFSVLTAADQSSDTATLADLARWTGGDMRIASVPAHWVEAVKDLLTELRHQYLITFEPGTRPGWHPLEIRTRKKNLVVRARSGYMSAPARSGS